MEEHVVIRTREKPPVFYGHCSRINKLIAIIVLIGILVAVFSGCGAGNSSRSKTIDWETIELNQVIPQPPSNQGTLYDNSDEELWISLDNVADNQYNDYLDSCQEKGFSLDQYKSSYSYIAYNSEGYRLDMSHIGDNLSIRLDAPMELRSITWPVGEAGKRVPAPVSSVGRFSYEREDGFSVYVGNTSKDDYYSYLSVCSEAGFTVDYEKDDNSYRAYDSDGWLLMLEYVGGNIMSVQVEPPVSESESETETITESDPSNTTEEPDTSEPTIEITDSSEQITEEEIKTEEETTEEPETTEKDDTGLSLGKINALATAESYLWIMAFSYEGLVDQLEYEGFTHEEAVYAADNCGADWNEEALESADSYLSYMAFSYSGLIDQLEYEQFTTEQATYAADNCGADWYEQAAKCAESYLEYMSFSRQGLIDQLIYEGFTYDQAVYGVEANGL